MLKKYLALFFNPDLIEDVLVLMENGLTSEEIFGYFEFFNVY